MIKSDGAFETWTDKMADANATRKTMFRETKCTPFCEKAKEGLERGSERSYLYLKALTVVNYADICSLFFEWDQPFRREFSPRLEGLDLILASDVCFDPLANNLQEVGIKVSRLVFDEADTIRYCVRSLGDARHTWLVTASWTENDDGTWKGLRSGRLDRVQCEANFIASSITLPMPVYSTIVCRSLHTDAVLRYVLDGEALEAVNALDYARIVSRHNPRAVTSDVDAIDVLLKDAVGDTESLEERLRSCLAALQRHDISPRDVRVYEAERESVTSALETARRTADNIRARLRDAEMCLICYDALVDIGTKRAVDERGFEALDYMLDREYDADESLEEAMGTAAKQTYGEPVDVGSLPKRLEALEELDSWRSKQPERLKRVILSGASLLEGAVRRAGWTKADRAAGKAIVDAFGNQSFVAALRGLELDKRSKRRHEELHAPASGFVQMTTRLRGRNMGQFADNRRATEWWTSSHAHEQLRDELYRKEYKPPRYVSMLRYFLAAGLRAPRHPRGFTRRYLYRGTDRVNLMIGALETTRKFHERSFSSWTWDEDVAASFGDRTLRLHLSDIRPGTPCVWFGLGNAASQVVGEREVLLPPGNFRLHKKQGRIYDVDFEPEPDFMRTTA
ncbi:hypothetical protein KFL_004900030 [Klebsormidium nitens]|uniref:Uncharacterized protein n=1 Tax=Klebsormidium nitens TaxID=105231 RepID=A0A1Y1IK52_KLENI|nr:hypothetical protein KFL_004900030 [Klebsormidium nitens]|eukprot:GAQ89136.1 hypothetical protein KFL_004900030 [Klebsormidium nitens]